MTEITISASVGDRPAVNQAIDVLKLKFLLQAVRPELANTVQTDGRMDSSAVAAIREFQKRFTANPDGRVDPGGPAFQRLQAQVRGSPGQRAAVSADLASAKIWLGVVNRCLGHSRNDDMRRKVKNIFHLDVRSQRDAGSYTLLRNRFVSLRKRFDDDFPCAYLPDNSAFGAFTLQGDPKGTMFFPANYAQQSSEDRVTTVIHERSHSVFKIGHAGMTQEAGTADFGSNPDDDNGFTTQQSFGNAYCYGWLAQALQPGYAPQAGGEVITVSQPKP